MKSLFLPSFSSIREKGHNNHAKNQLLHDEIKINKGGRELNISKIYENQQLTCNYDRDIQLSPTIHVEEDDKVIDNDFVLSKMNL